MVVPPSSKSNHYKLLGVARDATADDIKAAYRCLARELHPDKNKEIDAEERFKAVSLAYEVLGSPRRRREYDTCVLGEWSRGFAPSGVRRRNACGAGATDYVPPTSPPAGAALNRSLSRDAHEELRNARAARMERLKKTRDQRNAAPAKPEMTKEQKRFWKDRTEALRKKTPPPAAGAAAAAAAAASRTKDDDEDTAAPATAAAPAASTAAPASAGAAAPSRAASSSHLSTSSARRHASSAGAPRVSGTEPVGGCVPMPMPRSKRPAAVPRHPPTSPRSDATDSGVDAAGVKEGRKRVPKKRSVVSKRSKEAKEAAAPAVDASDAEHEEPKTVRRRAPAGGGRGVRNVSVSPVRCPSGSVTFQRSLSSSSATGLSKVPKMTKMEAGSGLRALPTVWRSFSGMAKPPTYPATGKA